MRVLLINDYGTPSGGNELVLLRIRSGLRARGHCVKLFASSARPGNLPSEADDHCLGTTTPFVALLQSANLDAYLRLKGVLKRFRPDVVYVGIFHTQLSPLILPLLTEIPSGYFMNFYRPNCMTGLKTLPNGLRCHHALGRVCYQQGCVPLRDWLPLMGQHWLWRRWHRVFDVVVVESECARRMMAPEVDVPIRLLRTGFPCRPMRPALVSPPTVLYAGRLVREKGVEPLVRAFATHVARISSARLLIAGDGPFRERLVDLVHDLRVEDSVQFLGHLGSAQLDEIAARAWVQVVPSLWPEPLGGVAIEAMMRGTAVIAFANGGLAETIEDNCAGFLIAPGDEKGLADRLGEVLADRSLAERLGQAGRKRASELYSETVFLDRLEQLLIELASGNLSKIKRDRAPPLPQQDAS